jgi:hypothetical protein
MLRRMRGWCRYPDWLDSLTYGCAMAALPGLGVGFVFALRHLTAQTPGWHWDLWICLYAALAGGLLSGQAVAHAWAEDRRQAEQERYLSERAVAARLEGVAEGRAGRGVK